jgi:hypothetical protein
MSLLNEKSNKQTKKFKQEINYHQFMLILILCSTIFGGNNLPPDDHISI